MGKQTRNSQKVTSPRKTDQIAMIVIEHTRAPKWPKSFYTHKFRDREQIPFQESHKVYEDREQLPFNNAPDPTGKWFKPKPWKKNFKSCTPPSEREQLLFQGYKVLKGFFLNYAARVITTVAVIGLR